MIRPFLSAALFILCAGLLSPSLARADDALPELTFEEDSALGNFDEPIAFFANLKDGDSVTSPVHIAFGITGMDIAPAGTVKPGTGHYHLLIDAELTPEEMDLPIPADETHLHYGKGQTEADIDLAPGPHTLQIIMGDANHMPHKPPVVSKRITVTVE